MIRFLLCLSLLVISSLASAKKVAVLLHGGDQKQLRHSMEELLALGENAYRHFGFEVIVLGGKKDPLLSSTKFLKAMSRLHGVTDLRIDFIGHGGVGNFDQHQAMHPGYQLPDDDEFKKAYRGMMGSDAPAFVAVDLNSYDVGPIRHFFSGLVRKTQLETTIGVGHIRKGIQQFHRNNPAVPVALSFLNCFSGMVAQQLADLKNVVVYSNSPALEPAIGLMSYAKEDSKGESYKVQTQNGLKFYYERSFYKNPPVSMSRAWNQANQKMSGLLASAGMAWLTGRSPEANFISSWCQRKRNSGSYRAPGDAESVMVAQIRERLSRAQQKVEGYFSSKEHQKGLKDHGMCVEHYQNLNAALQDEEDRLMKDWTASGLTVTRYIELATNNFLKRAEKDPVTVSKALQRVLVDQTRKKRDKARQEGAVVHNLRAFDVIIEKLEQPPSVFFNSFSQFMRTSARVCREQLVAQECNERLRLLSVMIEAAEDLEVFDVDCGALPRPSQDGPSCQYERRLEDKYCKGQWDRVPADQIELWKAYLASLHSEERWKCMKENVPVFVRSAFETFQRKLLPKKDYTKQCEHRGPAPARRARISIQRELKCLDRFEQGASQEDWERLREIRELGGRPARGI